MDEVELQAPPLRGISLASTMSAVEIVGSRELRPRHLPLTLPIMAATMPNVDITCPA